MKLLRSFILAGIIFWLHPVHAQTGPELIPSGEVPNIGTFWLVLPGMHSGYFVAPCPPVSVFNDSPYAVYYLSDGTYLVDNTAETGGLTADELNTASDLVLAEIAEDIAGQEAEAAMASPMTRMTMLASSLSSTYAYANPVYLTNMAVQFASGGSMAAAFSIAGGTNFVPYDILTATNLLTPVGSWNWISIGYTSNRYEFSNQPAGMAFYILAKPSKTMVVPWGDDFYGQCDLWSGITNAVQVTGGIEFSLALLNDGTVTGWGYNGATPSELVPTNLASVAMIASGWEHNVALFTNGTVTAWGDDTFQQLDVPAGLSNVTVISAQAVHSLALKNNGTVVAWGDNSFGESSVPVGLTNVTAISAGALHNLAVSNGFVVAWGYDGNGQTNVPPGLSNVVDVAAGPYHSLALLQNGTVVAWGDDSQGATNVPAGLTNVVAIAAGGDPDTDTAYSLGLKSDGTITVWGDSYVLDPVEGLNDVIAIGAGADHALAIRTGPRTQVITEEPVDQYQLTNGTVTFNSRGTGLYGVTYQWQFNGVNISGATNSALNVTNVQSANVGSYSVNVTDNGGMGSITSSNANLYLVTSPMILSQSPLSTNQVVLYSNTITLEVSASAPGQTDGFPISYQWQFDGTNISGTNLSNYTFTATNSGTYSLTVSNGAGSVTVAWQIIVASLGVTGWGSSSNGQLNASSTLTNVISLGAGEAHGVVALDSGSVSNWGSYWAGSSLVPVTPPPIITNAIAVAAGSRHDLALLQNGAVVGWGLNDFGQTNVPASATNAIAVAAGGQQSLALLQNGTVLQWGQTNASIPAGLTNVTAIAAGTNFCLALLSNATVVAWGVNNFGQTNVPVGLSNVVAIAASGSHALALVQNGTVVAWGDNTYGETNVPASLSNVMNIAAGDIHCIALENNGSVVAWGDNTFRETNGVIGLNDVKLIAGGNDFTLAVQFSPTVMYPVNVSQDLLLIYNTNSIGSTIVENYYLRNRPMVGAANVLGIGCTTNEITTSQNFTNQILLPYLNWLNQNPTKHPNYLILFLDTSRVEDSYTLRYPSVPYQLMTKTIGIEPFVNSINMNGLDGTNDCIAYINKLEFMGTNYSPGKLDISMSSGRYSNTNYYFDDTESGYGGYGAGLAGEEGVFANGAPSNSIVYTNEYPDCGSLSCHITSGTNVAGYLCWGAHSSLGNGYATNGFVKWFGDSSWWIIETIESDNGQRQQDTLQSDFIQWFSSNAFGGAAYSNTPIGAACYTEEPGADNLVNNETIYFGEWAAQKRFAMCAWNSRVTPNMQAVGDPFVSK